MSTTKKAKKKIKKKAKAPAPASTLEHKTITLRLSIKDHAVLKKKAGRMPMATYVKMKVFD